MPFILQLSRVRQRSSCYFTPNRPQPHPLPATLPLFLSSCVAFSTEILWNTRPGPTRFTRSCAVLTQREVHSASKEVRGDYKYTSMHISVRRFNTGSVCTLLDTRGRVSRDSWHTRRMRGNRRGIRCETGSGRGGQQDDGRRGEMHR